MKFEKTHLRTANLRLRIGMSAVTARVSDALRFNRPSTASSQRITESRRNSSASTTSASLKSYCPSSSFSRVHCCISSTTYRLWICSTFRTSTPGMSSANEHLDHELVPRGNGAVERGHEPVSEFPFAGNGDPEPLLWPLGVHFIRFDQPVSLKTLQRRVHLADVERPNVTGLLLELLSELVAVFRLLSE